MLGVRELFRTEGPGGTKRVVESRQPNDHEGGSSEDGTEKKWTEDAAAMCMPLNRS